MISTDHTPPDTIGLPTGARIVVAMSGGVDSSTTAALLKEQGYEVVGVTLQLYDHGVAVGRKGACCAGVDIYDARRVAETVGIPHYVLDYEQRFRTQVMDDFADTYLKGETPVPCVKCNQTVKFRDLLDTARDLGAQALVTGHYARRVQGANDAELHTGADLSKDQSYFLFATTPAQLDYLRFPLGGLTKDETRRLAARYALPVASKPDSQDICFVPNGNYASVVAKLRPGAIEPGDIVDLRGNVLGRHDGVINFTVGQRRGLNLGNIGGEPLYVVRLDPAAHRVVVGPRAALGCAEFVIRDLNWLDATPLNAAGREVAIKVRSAAPAVAARVFAAPNGARIVPHEPQDAVAPGQACVFYDGSRLLGGGWIARAESAALAA